MYEIFAHLFCFCIFLIISFAFLFVRLFLVFVLYLVSNFACVHIYLGIHFSSTGSYLNTKKKIVGKDTKAMYEILKKGRVHNLSIKCHYDLFDKMVKPILLYGMKYGFLVTMI